MWTIQRMDEMDDGEEWPEDIEEEDSEALKAREQAAWMENYYHALQELEGEEEQCKHGAEG